MSSPVRQLPELIAHRGNAAEFPENTLPAIRSALDLGVRYVEFDVQMSADRQPMLLNAAYLLDAVNGRDFTAAVAAEATAHPELRIELTGPWPPYSFTGDEHDGH